MRLTLQCDTCNSTFYSEPGRFEPDELCGLALSDDGPVCPGSLRDITPLSQREQARLARIQEQSRQLSLEECVYWLVIAEAPGAASAAARKEPVYLRREMRACSEYAKDRNESRVQRRRYIVIARLCAVAANLIREEQRIREEKR